MRFADSRGGRCFGAQGASCCRSVVCKTLLTWSLRGGALQAVRIDRKHYLKQNLPVGRVVPDGAKLACWVRVQALLPVVVPRVTPARQQGGPPRNILELWLVVAGHPIGIIWM